MSSPLFLETLEGRTLLSSPVVSLALPSALDAHMALFTDLRLARNATWSVGPDLSTESASNFHRLDPWVGSAGPWDEQPAHDLPGSGASRPSPSDTLLLPGDFLEPDFRLRGPEFNDLRPSAALVDSVMGLLESSHDNKKGDQDFREEGDEHRHEELDPTGFDRGLTGSTNPWSGGNVFRSLDELLSDSGLVDSPGGMDSGMLLSPLADGLVLDAWRDALPPPRPDLVPAAGRDLTVVAAYLVGTSPPTAPPTQDARDADPGLTEFIVGVSPTPAEADHRTTQVALPPQADLARGDEERLNPPVAEVQSVTVPGGSGARDGEGTTLPVATPAASVAGGIPGG